MQEVRLSEKLKTAMDEFGVSQSKLAREMGYSSTVISQYLAGSYAGDVSSVETAITKWIARRRENAQKKHVPVIETNVLKQINRALRLAHDEKDIALIVGDAGSGKTTAATAYVLDNPRTSILIKCYGMSRRVLTIELAKRLGLETQRVNFDRLVASVTETLRDSEQLIILDEADFLRDDALEFCRRLINDLGESGLALIGLPTLAYRIQNLKNDHRQLESRIGVFLHVNGLDKKDAAKIARTVFADCPDEIITATYKVSGRDTRQFVKIINRAQNIMIVNKEDSINLDIIDLASAMVMRKGVLNVS